MDLAAMLAERDALRSARDAAKVGSNADITLVHGPPCSGKTTYVAERKAPGDVVIDYDAIAVALGSEREHGHAKALHPFILNAIDSLLDRATRSPEVKVWLIKCNPTTRDINGARDQVAMNISAEECKRRALKAGRPDEWQRLIDEWFATHTTRTK